MTLISRPDRRFCDIRPGRTVARYIQMVFTPALIISLCLFSGQPRCKEASLERKESVKVDLYLLARYLAGNIKETYA